MLIQSLSKLFERTSWEMARVVPEWSGAHFRMFFTSKQLNCCVLTELKGEGAVLAQE